MLGASRYFQVIALLGCSAALAFAQPAGFEPIRAGDLVISGSLRTRVEAWSWFGGNADNDYAFSGSLLRVGLSRSTPRFEWRIEFAVPVLLGMPDDAIAPGAQGQFGLGASYFAANDRKVNAGMVFPKQGFVRLKNLGGAVGHSLALGRMEFIDGAEATPANLTLAALKRDRIAHRLLGNFGFSHVGRSFDAAQYVFSRSNLNITLLGGRPTRGVFQVDGWGELDAAVLYGAITGQVRRKRGDAEWRLFGLGYSDYRENVAKSDNRPLAVRAADGGHINIGTYGGHYVQTLPSAAGLLDFLFWGALQNGSWGRLAQRSGAFAVEAGWQPAGLALRPWLRGGFNYGSGDGNPDDRKHGTFFQVLPTPRIYARFPFFNAMNTSDAFGQIILRVTALSIRADVHSLRLADRDDLWYSGGGAFQPWTFGYAGRPSNGHSGLATLYDVSADYAATSRVTISGYYGHAEGGEVVRAIYPNRDNAHFGYLEMTVRF